jgi:general secretion pathway protein C
LILQGQAVLTGLLNPVVREENEEKVLSRLRLFEVSLSDFQGLISRPLLILVLMAAILYQGTGIFYGLLKLQLIRMKPALLSAEAVKTAAAQVRDPVAAYRIVSERNLFGATTRVAFDKQTGTSQQQDIALLIELRGTVAGEAPYGFAIIEEKGTRKQRLVKGGDSVLGAKVVRINRNTIDLLVDDRERTLKILETKETSILTPSSAVAPLPLPAGTMVISRSEIDDTLQDMGGMLRQAVVRPYFNAGVPEGFMITNIQSGSLYKKMGVIEGDVIQEVNNRKIQTVDDVMGLLTTIKGGSSMSVTLKRRGNQETLNYQFQ